MDVRGLSAEGNAFFQRCQDTVLVHVEFLKANRIRDTHQEHRPLHSNRVGSFCQTRSTDLGPVFSAERQSDLLCHAGAFDEIFYEPTDGRRASRAPGGFSVMSGPFPSAR